LDEPTIKTTSLISSETFRRKSAKSSPSSSKPSCYNHMIIMLHCTLDLFEDSHGVYIICWASPRFETSAMFCYHVLRDCTAFIFRLKHSKTSGLLRLLDPEKNAP
jgi:hypothetical protein